MTEKHGDSVVRWRARTTVRQQFPETELNHTLVAHGLDLIEAIAQLTENVVGMRAQRWGWALILGLPGSATCAALTTFTDFFGCR